MTSNFVPPSPSLPPRATTIAWYAWACALLSTLFGWLLLRTEHWPSLVVALLVLGSGPLPLLAGAMSQLPGFRSLVGWCMAGHVVAFLLAAAYIPSFLGQSPVWLLIGYLLWGGFWGLGVMHGLAASQALSAPDAAAARATNAPPLTSLVQDSVEGGSAALDANPADPPPSPPLTVPNESPPEPQGATTAEEPHGAAPDTGEAEALRTSLIAIATETWRVNKVAERMLRKLEARDQRRFQSRFDWFVDHVQESLAQGGIRIVNVEGQVFDPGMAATPLNLEDFAPEDELVVAQMIEPILMGQEGLVRMGTVTLKQGEEA